MKRIEYKDVNSIVQEYRNLFSQYIEEMQNKWCELREEYHELNAFPKNIVNILTAKFDNLALYYIDYQKNTSVTTECVVKLKELFDYKKKQSKIADFFMKHSKEMGISTCCYCDMSYVNVYSVNYNKNHSHFDLDHFFSQSDCPLLALSIFNLIPSCPVCNERLKHNKQLGSNYDEFKKLSPSSLWYSFDDDVKIKLMPKEIYKIPNFSDNQENFFIRFDTQSDQYKKEIEMFSLNERYEFHKCEALRLLDLQQKYNDTHIKMISRLLNRGEDSIKEDIFHNNFMTSQKRTFSKLYNDILNS